MSEWEYYILGVSTVFAFWGAIRLVSKILHHYRFERFH